MAYTAIYRKYRPATFDEVVGQDTIVRILKNQILSDRIGHAYLFTGIRGTGKTSIAKIFARAINCQNPVNGNPCNQCDICTTIETPGVMDVIEIDAASNRGVDEIRDIREKVSYPPRLGKYKVYIIDEVHMLTKEAFNALLKTLEEPPTHALFILATTEPGKIPATILSRCQRFDVHPISQTVIEKQMRKITDDLQVCIEDEALAVVAKRGDHSMRDSLSLLDQIVDIGQEGEIITESNVLDFLGMSREENLIALTESILTHNPAEVILRLDDMKQQGIDAAQVLGQLLDLLRRMLVILTTGKAAEDILELTQKEIEPYLAICRMTDTDTLFAMIELLIEERQKMRYNNLSSVILEMACLKLCTGQWRTLSQFDIAGNQEPMDSNPIQKTSTTPILGPQSQKKKIVSVQATPSTENRSQERSPNESPVVAKEKPSVPIKASSASQAPTEEIDLDRAFTAFLSARNGLDNNFIKMGQLALRPNNLIVWQTGGGNTLAINRVKKHKAAFDKIVKDLYGSQYSFNIGVFGEYRPQKTSEIPADMAWDLMNDLERTQAIAEGICPVTSK